jgi:hypothetical protein
LLIEHKVSETVGESQIHNSTRVCLFETVDKPLQNAKHSLLKKVQIPGNKGGKGLSLPFVSYASCHPVADNADEPFSAGGIPETLI